LKWKVPRRRPVTAVVGHQKELTSLAQKTIPEVKAEENKVARLVYSYGLLESVVKAIDKTETIASFGDRVQKQEPVLGNELLKKVNFALGVRNRLAHTSDVPTDEELASASEYFISAIGRHLPHLDEDDKKRFLGKAYIAPKAKVNTASKAKPKKKKGHKQRHKPKPLRFRAESVLISLATGGQANTKALNSLQSQGLSVAALRSFIPTASARKRIEKIRSLVSIITSRTNLPVKVVAVQQYLPLFELSEPAEQELLAIVDSYLIEKGRHPRTAQHLKDEEQTSVFALFSHPQPYRKPWWKFW